MIISPEPWHGHFVSKHHYALELAKRGHDVVFFGPPEACGSMYVEPVTYQGVSLRVVHSPKVFSGMRYLPPWVRRRLEQRWLKALEDILEQAIEVVWLFENSRFFDMGFAGARLKIYHQVDLNQDFNIETACRSADSVFCTSTQIKKTLSLFRDDVTIINHGSQAGQIEEAPVPTSLHDNKVNCVYAGNMSMAYLDCDLIIACVTSFPDISFHFFGGFTEGDPFRAKLLDNKNATLHGKIPAHELPAMLASADILMVTYQKEHFNDQSNPHKVMEYMMSGTVCVSTFTEEYKDRPDLIEMTSQIGDHDDYLALFEKVATDLPRYNAPERRSARRDFALDNTYDKQLTRIAQALGARGQLIN